MRSHGTIKTWNDTRGFGFIEPAGRTGMLFVHITAFPHDGRRPTVGELVSFRTEIDRGGRQRAVDVMRPGQVRRLVRPAPRQAEMHREAARHGRVARFLVGAVLLAAIGAFAWHRTAADGGEEDAASGVVSAAAAAHPFGSVPPASPFSCDGRTRCSQMRSCAEATYFIAHCPGTQMDGDHDGVPCESQWCDAGSRSD